MATWGGWPGKRFSKGSSQELSDQVLLLAAVERACEHNIVQDSPQVFNKHGSSSIWLFYVVGIDLDGWASVDQVEVPFLSVPKRAKQSPKLGIKLTVKS